MDDKAVPQVVMVSGACCAAHLAKADKAVEAILQQALGELGVTVTFRKVSLSALLAGGGDLPAPERQQILSLFQRYNTRFTPALMINGQVHFAGLQPTVAQLKDALQAAAAPQP